MALAKQILPRTRALLWGTRSLHTSQKLQDDTNYSKFMFNASGYNKYGLLKDDLVNHYDEDIIEAVRRLPEKVRLERTYRAIRAAQAEISHSILPKEQWTKYEDDHHYLQPYIAEVVAEREEREEWEANH